MPRRHLRQARSQPLIIIRRIHSARRLEWVLQSPWIKSIVHLFLIMKYLLVIMMIMLGTGNRLRAQGGSWHPAGADLAYPRTLLHTRADLDRIRNSIQLPERRAIYLSLWADVQKIPDSDNTSTSGRRARATFAKNAAFVGLIARQSDGGRGLRPLSDSQSQALLTTTRSLLENINTDVEVFATWTGTTPYTEWQWRSKELIDYLIAFDLLRGAGVTATTLAASQARIQEFAGHLFQQSTTSLGGFSFFRSIKNNHTLMTAAALGLAALVLNEATSLNSNEQPLNWAGAGLYHIDNILWRDAQRQSDSTRVTGYAEGPYYFKYAMLNCLPFFRAMGNFLPDSTASQVYTFGGTARRIANPYFDPKYDRLYDWLTAIRMPDGRFPALDDSYVDMGMPELALTGKRRYVKPMFYSKFSGTPLASLVAQLRDITVDMRAAWLAAAVLPAVLSPLEPGTPTLTVLPGSGNLVFRSGDDSLATYLHLYGRGELAQSNSGGHSQGDASSFILHAKGQLLALDPGYLSYARRGEVGQASNHNLVLVDGAGPAMGSPGMASPVQSTVQNALQTPALAYGEVRTSYQNTSLTRKVLFVRQTYFLLVDAISASGPHTFTWQLHGYGQQGGTSLTGYFINNLPVHEGVWQKNGVSLLAHVTSTGGTATYTTATAPHETTYNTAENHTVLLVQHTGEAPVQFLAALFPYSGLRPRVMTTSQPATAALTTISSEFIDVAFTQADSLVRIDASGKLPQAVSADGLLNFYSAASSGGFAQLFVQEGTQLNLGAQTVVHSTRRATLSWQRTSTTRFGGYASRATTLTLALDRAPLTVTGPDLLSYSYAASRHQLTVTLGAASTFQVVLPAGTALSAGPEAETSGKPTPLAPTLLPALPQPAATTLLVQVAGTNQPVTLLLLDGVGRKVRQQLCHQQAQIDVSMLTPGLYYLVGYDEAGRPLAGRQTIVVGL